MFRNEFYQIKSGKITKPVKLVMLADLHNHTYGEENERLLSEIEKHSPDFICIAGDLLIGHSQESYEVAQNLTLALAKRYPIFYGLGNHESRMRRDRQIYKNRFEEYSEPLRKAGVRFLIDEHQQLDINGNRMVIYGYDLPMKYFEKFNRYVFEQEQVEEALGSCNKTSFSILLAHNPVYFQQYAGWGADLTLSGHLHGGIIRLPILGGIITPQAKLFPRYCAGKYCLGDRQMIVSRGLGTHTIPIRFHNPPELSVISIEPE